ncbi:biotin-dependent 2-oxo acid dehydrogenases acyltransferase [Aspergillus heteromorphus CBS 117.55]|uniref:Dihydrolipoamide acetyltransferase component of pyruvate dehydrogenase complex n=1 Tax=Aspergillus heteromorphus CBS 117.55 TaxID=1448321 RepID=A0A317W6H5_9EURO|nr:biotin-dependent 2-oxo acid dehydrogenases acyltransferase [Aspergillus heteromorphus CBS 117.55]PWY80608.1 biotin-dependent 2-oxo acid dehydrogenases acyltransferase [Aspergillus heteromorphus CBS 117.55]
MNVLRSSGSFSSALRTCQRSRALPIARCQAIPLPRRQFHASSSLWGIKSQVLKDVGEGITEVQIIQWYVEEGAYIEEWKPLCQYQSDKAVDDITSRYEGVVKKLHFQADDTAPTGKELCDIEVEDGKYPDDSPPPEIKSEPTPPTPTPEAPKISQPVEAPRFSPAPVKQSITSTPGKSLHATLATPAVRGLLKMHDVNIEDVRGTGKDGRVLKEDVQRFIITRDSVDTVQPQPAKQQTQQDETVVKLTPVQSQMFKTMTRSLNIPHFLYADELNINNLNAIRKKLAADPKDPKKITLLAFAIKAMSLALNEYPLLNAKIDTSDPDKPRLIMRAKHNIGVAMDTPQGLLVPNIKDVASRSVLDVASEISRLNALAKAGKLTPADLSGGTITISNIGNIGGTYVSPVIVSTEVAILGVGKAKTVPIFDDEGQVIKGEHVNFSWSADHRVVDGATMARMGNRIRELLESPELMLLNLR